MDLKCIELKLNLNWIKKVVVGKEFRIERQLVQNLPDLSSAFQKSQIFFNEDLLVLIFEITIETKIGEKREIEVTWLDLRK